MPSASYLVVPSFQLEVRFAVATTSGGNPYSSAAFGSNPTPVNGLGIAGFVLSIIGVLTCGTLNIVSLPISMIALLWRPRGFAIAGTVISFLGVGFLALVGWGIVAGVMGLKGIAEEITRINETNIAIADARNAIENYRREHNTLPDGIEGNKLVVPFKDGWQTELRYEVDGNEYVIRSAGPDKAFDTPDDLTSHEQQVETNLDIDIGDGPIDGPVMIPEGASGEIKLPAEDPSGAVENSDESE
jgi:type II secretory pathway pseudopilin PulG